MSESELRLNMHATVKMKQVMRMRLCDIIFTVHHVRESMKWGTRVRGRDVAVDSC